MIVVDLVYGAWMWIMISADGRILAYDGKRYDTEKGAFKAALSYRVNFWSYACTVDHRMGACI